MAYEDGRVFAVLSPNIATAVMAINTVGCGHLLKMIVPDSHRFWLIFKHDSGLVAKWAKEFPHATVLPRSKEFPDATVLQR